MSTQVSGSLAEKVIKKLEDAINILRLIEIKDNEEPLATINDHVDDILSNLKYFPNGLSFGNLPTEIKTDILSYLCDLGVFVASSVSQEWKNIMETRLNKMEKITIGKHCSNEYECEDNKCFMPEEILKASLVLKLDIPLSLCYPLCNVDSDVIIEGLVSSFSFSIQGECSCVDIVDEDSDDIAILTYLEFDKVFEVLSKKNKVMNSVRLAELDLSGLNQDKLINGLVKKTHSLILDGGEHYTDDSLVNIHDLIKRILNLQASHDSKLKRLNLYNLDLYNDMDMNRDIDEDLADAVCNLYSVHIGWFHFIDKDLPKRLIHNILNRPITLEKIKISYYFDWNALIEPDDLKTMIEKLIAVDLEGEFSPEQVEAVRVLPGVQASVDRITKGEFD